LFLLLLLPLADTTRSRDNDPAAADEVLWKADFLVERLIRPNELVNFDLENKMDRSTSDGSRSAATDIIEVVVRRRRRLVDEASQFAIFLVTFLVEYYKWMVSILVV
jgi:hypothetical protein